MTFRINPTAKLVLGLAAMLSLAACVTEQAATGASTPTSKPTSTVQSAAINLADYDAGLGRRFFIQCQACHSLGENEPHKTGPNLWGLIGRPAGRVEGFDYSEALANADLQWSVEVLDRFLIKPDDVVPGTTMIFAGIANEANRRHLLAYLQQATQAAGK